MRIDREELRVAGGDLADKVKELIHERNVRRIIVKNVEGQTIMEVPVTAGVLVALVAPVLAAVGALAALASEWSVVVERSEDNEPDAD
ncbi:MAG: DUF4342 domain-containing protein [Actinomycetota bacterium]